MFRVLFIATLVILVQTSRFDCDFDYGDTCFDYMSTASYVLLNQSSERPRQPPSDVTAIQTQNSNGICEFPYRYSTFDMYFCLKTDNNTQSTCPNQNSSGTTLNCHEGDYGYEMFDYQTTNSRLHRLNIQKTINAGPHCLRFYHFFSDNSSDASIEVILEEEGASQNQTLVRVEPQLNPDRWNEIRQNFLVINSASKLYFLFSRQNAVVDPFFIAIDEIKLIDIYCDDTDFIQPTTTTASTPATTSTSAIPAVVSTTTSNVISTTTSRSLVCNRTLTPTKAVEITTSTSIPINPETPVDDTTTTSSGVPVGQTTTSSGVPVGQTTTSSGVPVGQTTTSSGVPVGQTTTSSGVPVGQTTTSSGVPGGQTTTEPSGAVSIFNTSMTIMTVTITYFFAFKF